MLPEALILYRVQRQFGVRHMFETAFVIMDGYARPILIIPEDLPEGNAVLSIVDGGFDIKVGKKLCGKIRKVDEASLTMLGMQDAVGMATFKAEDGEEMPDKIQYVAEVRETRFD